MRIWKLDNIDYDGYGEYYGFVIRASSPRSARKIAAEKTKKKKWLNPKRVLCSEVKLEGEPRIIFSDFLPG